MFYEDQIVKIRLLYIMKTIDSMRTRTYQITLALSYY